MGNASNDFIKQVRDGSGQLTLTHDDVKRVGRSKIAIGNDLLLRSTKAPLSVSVAQIIGIAIDEVIDRSMGIACDDACRRKDEFEVHIHGTISMAGTLIHAIEVAFSPNATGDQSDDDLRSVACALEDEIQMTLGKPDDETEIVYFRGNDGVLRHWNECPPLA
ncbi:MAG: hypothetical protein KDI55_00305 [Anaerolineae bacterium]|nr:hypothetical protein [Anaerolineae bacterium]